MGVVWPLSLPDTTWKSGWQWSGPCLYLSQPGDLGGSVLVPVSTSLRQPGNLGGSGLVPVSTSLTQPGNLGDSGLVPVST